MQLFIATYLSGLLNPQMLWSSVKGKRGAVRRPVDINRNTNKFLQLYQGLLTKDDLQSPSTTTASNHKSLLMVKSPPVKDDQ
jgi:hypothetical protein